MTDETRPAQELRAAAVRGVRWSSLSRPTAEAVQLASMVVLAHLIAPADFGRYAVALIAQEGAYMLVGSGLSSALIQLETITREHLQAGMVLALLGGLALAALTLLAAGLVVAPVFGARTALFVRLMAPLCLISAAGTVPLATLSRRMAFRRLSEIEMLAPLARACGGISLALAGLGGTALVCGTLAGALVSSGVAWASAPPPPPRPRRAAGRELLRFGLPVSASAIGWIGFSNVDYAIVGARLGSLQAGLYFRAYTLAVEYQKKLSVVMSQVGFPVLARTRNAAELSDLRRQMVRTLTLVLFPLLALLSIAAPVLVPFLFGHDWAGAVAPVRVLALGGACTLAIDAAGTVLLASGRTRALLGFGMAHFLAYGLAVLVVVPLGIVAVAIAATVVHMLFLIVAYALMMRGTAERPLRRLWSDVAPATVSCAGLVASALPASLALSAAHAPAVLWLAALGLLAAPSYLLTLRVCFPASARSLGAVLGEIMPERRPLRGTRLVAALRARA